MGDCEFFTDEVMVGVTGERWYGSGFRVTTREGYVLEVNVVGKFHPR